MTLNTNSILIREYNHGDDIAKLDFTEDDGSDPLNVDNFFKTKVKHFLDSDLCSLFVVLYENNLVGCFTLFMNGISTKHLSER